MTESIGVQKNPMETENLNKLILKFALPCGVAMVVSALYNIVDQIFIGQGVGYIGNAATTVGFPLIVLAQGFALLFGDGAAAFYSIKLGENNKKTGAKGIGNAIVMLVLTGMIFLIIISLFLEKILWSFGATSTNITYAFDYMKIVVLSFPFMVLSCGLSSIIRADGSPEYGMISLFIGTLLNFILDPVLIFIFNMGVKGAAIATVVGEIVSCIMCLNYLRKFKNVKLERECFKLDFSVLKMVILFGISTFITQIAVTLIVIVSNNMLKFYGAQSVYGSDIPLSAIGIVMKVNDILLGIVIGIAAGGQPIAGYNYGARNFKRVRETYFILIKISTIVSIIGFIIFQFFPQIIINIFGSNEGLYNEFSIKSFRIFLMLCIFMGFELTTTIFFQAIGKPVKSILLTLCKQTIFIVPLMIILPRFLGIEGILYAGPVAEIMSVIVTAALIKGQLREFDIMDVRNKSIL